jgi:hypothetical protein
MRIELIQRSNSLAKRSFHHSSEKKCKFLTLLMNDQVSSMSFPQLPRTADQDALKNVTDLWFSMSRKCPDLQQLVCDEDNVSPSTYGQKKDASKQVVLFGLVLHFSELQVLKMPNLECNNFRLGFLAKCLPKLRYNWCLKFFYPLVD